MRIFPNFFRVTLTVLALGFLFAGSGNAQLASKTNLPVFLRKDVAPTEALTHLDYTPGHSPKFWSVAAADTVMARWPDFTQAYFNAWTYVNGYELYGFEMLYRATGDKKYFDYAKRYVGECVDADGNFRYVVNAKGQTNKPSFNNLDNMMAGNSLVWLYEETKDDRYKKSAAQSTIIRAIATADFGTTNA